MRVVNPRIVGIGCGLFAIALSGACGKKSSSETATSAGEENLTVKVKDVGAAGATSLSLVDADSFSGSISGCLSGYSKTGITSATTALKLARNDQSCVFKLDAFAFGGKSYAMTGGVWAAGSSFVATSTDGSKLRFSVVSNIAAVVSGAQSVAIVFSALDVGPSQSAGANIGASVSIAGAEPVLFDVSYIDVSVDGATGGGVFDMKLQCGSALVGSGLTANCGGLVLSKMRFGLAKNTLPASPSLDDCRAIAVAGNLSVAAADVVPVGDGTMPNGGVVAPQMKGPVKLFDAGSLSLVMAVASSDANGSCKYFPIAITPP